MVQFVQSIFPVYIYIDLWLQLCAFSFCLVRLHFTAVLIAIWNSLEAKTNKKNQDFAWH